MTSLTPQHDAFVRAMADARAASDARPANSTLGVIERRLCLDVMEAALGPCAEMMDLDVPFLGVQSRLEQAIANVIVSRSLSMTGGGKTEATKFAITTLLSLGDLVRRGIENGNPAIQVIADVDVLTAGRS